MATITESFDTADSDTLGPDLAWTELVGDFDIVTNKARNATQGDNDARADSALSSSNHYAQAAVTANTTNSNYAAVVLRKDNTATQTKYECEAAWAVNRWQVSKRVAGSYSVIAFGGTSVPTSGTLKGSVESANPATLKTYWDGVEKVSTSDSDVDTGTYTGIHSYHSSVASRTVDFDNFEAGDLAGASRIMFRGN
jgi:hypothetical protein